MWLELDGAALHVVNEASWRCDDDLQAFPEAAQLPFHILAAVNRQCLDRRELGQMIHFFGYLHCQFARRR